MVHHCNKTTRNENLVNTVRQFSSEGKKKVAAKLLNEITAEEKVDKRNGSLDLPSGSRTLTVNFGPKKFKQMRIDDMIRLKVSENLSNEQTYGVANAMRVTFGRSSVEAGLSQAVPNHKWKLEEFFTMKAIVVTEKKEKVETILTHELFLCDDLDSLITEALVARGIEPDNVELICSIDDGQQMLKVMLFIKTRDLEQDNSRRAYYSDGVASKASKLSSVNRLFIIGIIPGAQETYTNLKAILKEVKVCRVPNVTFSADLKLCNNLVGKQGGQCRHACCFCTSCAPWTDEYKLLTIGDLKRNHEQYVKAVKADPAAQAMDYQNCVNECLLENSDDTVIMDIINLPELHCHIGIVSKLLEYIETSVCDPLSGDKKDKVKVQEDAVKKAAARKWVDQFLQDASITRPEYRGGRTLEGNAAKKMISEKNIAELKERAKLLSMKKAFRVLGAAKSLELFRAVVDSCFGYTIQVNSFYIIFLIESFKSHS